MIYLDNAATTKPNKKALEYAEKFNDEMFYNPSALYQGGLDASNEIKKTKEILLKYLGVSSADYEVVFTSCGSEADNQAVFCSVKRGVFVTSKGEHSAIYKSFLELKNKGFSVQFIDLKPDGSVDEEQLYQFVSSNKVDFVSLVHVNNETGAVNDVNAISKKLKEINPKLVFHADGVQAFGKLVYKLANTVDFYSISAHKINGLKGTGALVRRKKTTLSPYIIGGGQENGLRSGTENVFGIKVFEFAMKERFANLTNNYSKITQLNNYLRDNLDKNIFKIISSDTACPYVLSVSAVGLRGEVVMHSMEGFGVVFGNGSACSSKNRYSRVLEACGYDKNVLDGVIRISFSPDNTMDEIVFVTEKLNETAKKLKEIMR